MALRFHNHFAYAKRRYMLSQSSGDGKENLEGVTTRLGRSTAANEFAPLALTFRRQLLAGIGSASLVAVGANFGGVTSFLIGLSPESGRNLKLDVVYPIQGYSRCIDPNQGFEFIYPANWVGDQTLLYRAAERTEMETSLDLPHMSTNNVRRRNNVNEPIVAFGPPGSSGELNVSVIVSPVPQDFSIEAFGGSREVGEAVIKTIVGSSRRPDVRGMLIGSNLREDSVRNTKYYELEFRVESPLFRRHNVAVCCAHRGRLFTLNAQSPESKWPESKADFYKIANSFCVTF